MQDNPYEAPVARVADVPQRKDPEVDRREHLQRESGLRGIGVVCLAVAAFLLLGAARAALGGDGGATSPPLGPFALGTLFGAAAWGYLGLRWWTRLPAVAIATLVLFGSAFLATPLVGYAAWLTWSKKGRRVLDTDYAYVRALTPHLQAWRRPMEAIVFLLLVAAYVMFFLSLMRRMPY